MSTAEARARDAICALPNVRAPDLRAQFLTEVLDALSDMKDKRSAVARR